MSNVPSFLRHNKLIGPHSFGQVEFVILGCGAVGSNVALGLAKLGVNYFDLWDHDDVEDYNLPNQAYSVQHIGMKKVDALKDVLTSFNPEIICSTNSCKMEDITCLDFQVRPKVIIYAVDSLNVRKFLTEQIRDNFIEEIIAIYEVRLGFTHGESMSFNPQNLIHIDEYINTLEDDSKIADSPCNAKIIPNIVLLSTSLILSYVTLDFSVEKSSIPYRRSIFSFDDKVSLCNLTCNF